MEEKYSIKADESPCVLKMKVILGFTVPSGT
jgi:hypothetical protein